MPGNSRRTSCRRQDHPVLCGLFGGLGRVLAGAVWATLLLVGTDGRSVAEDGTATPAEHPLAPAIRFAKKSLVTLENVNDYEAVFHRREVVANRLQAPQTMTVKFRRKPMSVYLRFHRPSEGREVLYVEGQNQGNLLVHESGIKAIVGTLALAPNSPQVMAETRYPITMIGLQTMAEQVVKQWEEETRFGEVEVKYFPAAKLGEMECKVIQSVHPEPRREFKFHMTRLYIDKQTDFPVRVEQYGFPATPGGEPVLVEEYTYTNIRTNVGLADVDFDRRNPRYRF